MTMQNGFLILDKPKGISSNRALQRVKRLLGVKKAGHAGTLDPLASGLLPICIGEATKFSSYLLAADKTYETVMQLGVRTTTSDAEGEVIEVRAVEVTDERLQQVLNSFRGKQQQQPSLYSALKYQGKPLYEYARKGIDVPRPIRDIEIFELHLIARRGDLVTLSVRCSKGTYIRTLVDDMGEALGCGAHVVELRRLASGPFTEEQMISLGVLEESLHPEQFLLPVDAPLQYLPQLKLNSEQVKKLYFGQLVEVAVSPVDLVRLLDEHDHFVGLGVVDDQQNLKSIRLLQQ